MSSAELEVKKWQSDRQFLYPPPPHFCPERNILLYFKDKLFCSLLFFLINKTCIISQCNVKSLGEVLLWSVVKKTQIQAQKQCVLLPADVFIVAKMKLRLTERWYYYYSGLKGGSRSEGGRRSSERNAAGGRMRRRLFLRASTKAEVSVTKKIIWSQILT